MLESNILDMVKKFKLDLKDRKILSELDWNARLSCAEIGRRVGLPKNVVDYRIKQLEKYRVILGYYPVIDIVKLGFYSRRILIKFNHVNETTKESIIQYLRKNKVFAWSVLCTGEYDLGISVRLRNPYEHLDELNNFLTKFSKYIAKRDYSETLRRIEYPMSFLCNSPRGKVNRIEGPFSSESLDHIDQKILNQLENNARSSIMYIASQLNLSVKTISLRLKSLFSRKIVVGTRAMINYKYFNIDSYKIFLKVDLSKKNKVLNLLEYLSQQIETAYIVDLISNEDIDFEVYVDSSQGPSSFIGRLQDKFSEIISSCKYLKLEKVIKMEHLSFH